MEDTSSATDPAPPQMLSLTFRLPAPALQPYLTSYYLLRAGADGIDDWLPPEWSNARIVLSGQWSWAAGDDAPGPTPGCALFGPTSRAARTRSGPGASLIGIGLTPLGWARLVGVSAETWTDGATDLAAHWPEIAGLQATLAAMTDDDARFALVEERLLARLARSTAGDPAWGRAFQTLMGGDISTVTAFAAGAGLHVRTLSRLSAAFFGFGPKPLLRRQRFLRALDRMQRSPGETLTDLFGDEFTDQAHFVREFRAFMGMTPTAYRALPRELMKVAAAERMRMVGQGLQGLHPSPA
jgi:AraC-like DNA-binding protein